MVASVVKRTAVQADSAKTSFDMKFVSPGDGSGDVAAHASTDSSGVPINPATHEDLVNLLAKDESIRAILAGILSIQGTVTANLGTLNGAASDAVLSQILAAIKGQINVANLFVTDGTKTYVRREQVNEGTGVISVVFENMDGTLASPQPAASSLTVITGSSSSSSAASGKIATPVYYDVLIAGTGYALSDTIAEVVITDTSTGALSVSWQNLTQGTTITAPPSTSVRKQVKSVSIMSQSAGLALDTSTQQLVASIGSTADLATASTLVGILKAILARTPGLGAAAAAASSPVALATDQLSVIAKDASVQSLVTAIGSTSDLVTALTVIGNLKAIKADLDTGLQNDTKAFTYIDATTTREGALATALPEAFDAGASGKIGALSMIWKKVTAAASSLATMVGLLQNSTYSGASAASGNFTSPLGSFSTHSIVLAGDAVGTLSVVGTVTLDGSIYEVPLKIRGFGSTSAAVDSITSATAGAWNGAYFIETAGLQGVQFVFTRTSGSLTYRAVASRRDKSVRIHAPQTDAAWVTTTPWGIGDSFPIAVAASTAIGAAIAVPTGARSMLVELPPGAAIKYAMKTAAPTAAPTGQVLRSNPTSVVLDFEQSVGNGRVMYVTSWTAGTDGSVPVISFL